MTYIVETVNLTKRFSKETNYRALLRLKRQETITAVDAVNLQIREGELFGLLGANGAGKTTLVKILCTLILPTEGQAFVSGKDVVAEATAVRQMIGLIDTNERSFFWRLSGRHNLEFFAALHGLTGMAAQTRINELLDMLGLSHAADQRFFGYSSGMRQKLAIARGLLAVPRIILLDEPTRSLDPVSAHELRTFVNTVLVKQLGHTVLLVTHRLEEAEALCDRVAIMKAGKLIACGPVTEIKQYVTARHQYRLQVQHLPPAEVQNLAQLPGIVQLDYTTEADGRVDMKLILSDEKEILPFVLQFIVTHGGHIQHCQAQMVSLEKAFVQLVK